MIDTDVLVWFYRGLDSAKKLVLDHIPFSISTVTYLELLRGVRDKGEMRKLRRDLSVWGTTILPLNESVSARGTALMEVYTLSHGLELADALIAATALERREILITGNLKHYQYIPALRIVPFRPW